MRLLKTPWSTLTLKAKKALLKDCGQPEFWAYRVWDHIATQVKDDLIYVENRNLIAEANYVNNLLKETKCEPLPQQSILSNYQAFKECQKMLSKK